MDTLSVSLVDPHHTGMAEVLHAAMAADEVVAVTLPGARGRVHLRVPIKIWPLARSLLVRRWRPFPRLSSSSRALLGTQLIRARGPRRGRGMIVARN